MKSEEIVIEDLCNKYSKIGYITYDDIIEYSSKNNLTNIHIEYIQNVLIHRGVIINNDSESIVQKPQSTISHTNMTEKTEKIAINYLYILFKWKGYVSEEDIFNVCDELDLSFSKIDYIGNQILAKGVLISDGLTSAETTSLQEPITYNEKKPKIKKKVSVIEKTQSDKVYAYFLYHYPGMRTVIEASINTPRLKVDEAENLISQIRSGNLRAREILIIKYIHRVLKFVMYYQNITTISLDEIFGEAMIGLMKAIDSYDYYSHSRFSSYASSWMKQNIDRYISDHERLIRIPVHLLDKVKKAKRIVSSTTYFNDKMIVEKIQNELYLSREEAEDILKYLNPENIASIEEIFEKDGEIINYESLYLEDDVYTLIENKMDILIIQKVVATLPYRVQKIVKLRYGLQDGRSRTLEEVGRIMSLTRERVRQIEAKGIRLLKHPSRLKYLSSYYDRW